MELLDRDNVSVTSRDNWLRIKRSDPSLIWLTVTSVLVPKSSHNKIIEDSEIGELGRDIGCNTHLRRLQFLGEKPCHDIDDSNEQYKLLCKGLKENQSIEELNLVCFNQAEGEIWEFLGPFLENDKNLKRLRVYNGVDGSISCEGMRLLVTPLMRRCSPLDKLEIADSRIDDSILIELIMAFQENPALTPKALDLRCNDIDVYGCKLIARLLRGPRCTMESLTLWENEFDTQDDYDDVETINLFTNALIENTTLKELDLTFNHTANGIEAFSQFLCNTANISATYFSNHTIHFFRGLDVGNPLHNDLKVYLEWNENVNKKMVARQKIFMQHFIRDFNMHPFKEMKSDLLVHVLSFIDKASSETNGSVNDSARCSIIFHLLKNDPMVCKIDKTGSMEDTNPSKRRRSKRRRTLSNRK